MTLNVITVTLNPALDLTGSLSKLSVGKVNLINASDFHPAGKGINVAKVLSNLGAKVTVTGLLGENNQQPFIDLFSEINAKDEFIRVAGNTRINVKIAERSGQMTDLNFPGIIVTEDNINALEARLFSLALSHDIFIIAGSLPQGLSSEKCAYWIRELQKRGKKVFFDSSNQSLIDGVNSNPYLIKPNDEELSTLLDTRLTNKNDIQQAAEKLQQTTCENVVISMGEQGVIWCNKEGTLQSTPPSVTAISTVGAGDTLVAALCWGMLNQWSKSKTLKFATALSAQAVTQVGVGVTDLNALKILEKQVILT
jgi:1-phosphofructokinase